MEKATTDLIETLRTGIRFLWGRHVMLITISSCVSRGRQGWNGTFPQDFLRTSRGTNGRTDKRIKPYVVLYHSCSLFYIFEKDEGKDIRKKKKNDKKDIRPRVQYNSSRKKRGRSEKKKK